MDFDKTSFSVDWFTPGDKYAPKRLSFPKSACISIDDLVSDTPLGFCFSPAEEPSPRPRSHSIIDFPFERACGWANSAPPSPLVPSDREQDPMYDQDPKPYEESWVDWRMRASPGLLSVTDECALCGVDLDIACLDGLDEQLLLSPVESFTELCWAAVVDDDVTAPVIPRRNTRSRARSFKCDYERAFPSSPLARDYPGSFERTRPLAAKITLPLGTSLRYPSSPYSEFGTSLMLPEKPLAYILHTDPEGCPLTLPVQGKPLPRRSKKQVLTLTPSFDSLAHAQPSKPRLQSSKSSHTLRVISDACSTFTRPRRKSPQ
ncbi:hypothetical protein J3R82DRAFT_3158 [Butyriboletus roseoflavus]|nr:hypothetical protein J3R82DRAFT_3158 [Butyriboletus roseoflavus]